MENKDTMLGRIMSALVSVPAEMLGTILDLIRKLAGENGQETWELLKKLLRGEVQAVKANILKLIGTVQVPDMTEPFVAKDHFVVNTSDDAEVKISFVWDGFQNEFLAGDGKEEMGLDARELVYYDLVQRSVDGPIITELGGKEKAETTLAEIWRLLLKQPKGQGGALPTNGCASIFYVKNTSGVLRAVYVGWHDGGWSVDVNSIEDPDPWSVGSRVFSRLPLVA